MSNWFVYRPGDKPLGPLSLEQLAEGLVRGRMATSSLVAVGGDPRWRLVTDVAEVVDAQKELEKKGTGEEPPDALPSFPPFLDPDRTQELLALDLDPPPEGGAEFATVPIKLPSIPPPPAVPSVPAMMPSQPPPPARPPSAGALPAITAPPKSSSALPAVPRKPREPLVAPWPRVADPHRDRLIPLGVFAGFAVLTLFLVIVHAATTTSTPSKSFTAATAASR